VNFNPVLLEPQSKDLPVRKRRPHGIKMLSIQVAVLILRQATRERYSFALESFTVVLTRCFIEQGPSTAAREAFG